MPIKPFQYYIFGYRDFVLARDFDNYEASDAASSFLNLVISKLKEQPEFVKPILPDLMEDIEFIANNQELYEADESIYGNFKEKLQTIMSLSESA